MHKSLSYPPRSVDDRLLLNDSRPSEAVCVAAMSRIVVETVTISSISYTPVSWCWQAISFQPVNASRRVVAEAVIGQWPKPLQTNAMACVTECAQNSDCNYAASEVANSRRHFDGLSKRRRDFGVRRFSVCLGHVRGQSAASEPATRTEKLRSLCNCVRLAWKTRDYEKRDSAGRPLLRQDCRVTENFPMLRISEAMGINIMSQLVSCVQRL